MDALNSMCLAAENATLFHPIGGRLGLPHKLSLYADDAVVFLTPVRSELLAFKEILKLFGEASSLRTNLTKSSVTPIRCNDLDIQLISDCLQCNMSVFPCKYLGLPLTLRKPCRTDFQPLLDLVVNRLQAWQTSMLS